MRPLSEQRVKVLVENSNGTLFISKTLTLPATATGQIIRSLYDLKVKIAALKAANSGYTIFYRGQSRDWRWGDEEESSIFPSALRHYILTGEAKVKEHNPEQLINDYPGAIGALQRALPGSLLKRYANSSRKPIPFGIEYLALVQHYEILPTLLLDVTTNLQVACSFADNGGKESFLYLLAIPNFSEPVSVNVDAGLIIADLTKVCPSSALRPHFQDGYVVAPYPGLHTNWDSLTRGSPDLPTNKTKINGWNFARIVIAKFALSEEFWKDKDVHVLSRKSLFPTSDDPIFQVGNNFRSQLGLPPKTDIQSEEKDKKTF